MKCFFTTALALLLLGCADESRNGLLRACLGEADPPRSQIPGVGFDVDVAQLLADRLQRNLEIVWLPTPKARDIESTDLDFKQLLNGNCDMRLSVPGRDAIAQYQESLFLSDPYYGAAFELLPNDGDLDSSQRVAVRANTVAHVFIDARGINWTMQRDSASIVAAIRTGKADTGLIWGPDLALVDASRNEAFIAPPILRWNQHVAVRTYDHELRADIDAALKSSRQTVVDLLVKHGIPPHEPFETSHQFNDLRTLK